MTQYVYTIGIYGYLNEQIKSLDFRRFKQMIKSLETPIQRSYGARVQ